MNTSKLADISEIVSSIAIVATLIFLAFQMQHNTQAIEASTRGASQDSYSEWIKVLLEHPDALQALEKSELSAEEAIKAQATLLLLFRIRENDWAQYQRGVMDESTWERIERALVPVLQIEGVQNWWTNYGTRRFSPGFVAKINAVKDETSVVKDLTNTIIISVFKSPDEYKQIMGPLLQKNTEP